MYILSFHYPSYYNQKWGLTAYCPKAIKKARLVEREVALFWKLATGRGGGSGFYLKGDSSLPNDNQWARAFIGGGRGLPAGQPSLL